MGLATCPSARVGSAWPRGGCAHSIEKGGCTNCRNIAQNGHGWTKIDRFVGRRSTRVAEKDVRVHGFVDGKSQIRRVGDWEILYECGEKRRASLCGAVPLNTKGCRRSLNSRHGK